MDPLKRGRLLVLGAALAWSSAGAAVKVAHEHLSGLQIATVRSLFALLFLLVMIRPVLRGRWWPGWRVFALALAYATMMFCYVGAITLTTAANAIFIQDTAPIWVMLLSPWMLKESFRPRDLGVMFFCLCGLTLFFVDKLEAGQALGNWMALISGVAYALVLLGLRWGRARSNNVPGRDATSDTAHALTKTGPSDAEMLVIWGNLLTVVIGIPAGIPWPYFDGAATSYAVAAGLGVLQLGLGYYLMTAGMRHVPAVEASLFSLIEPILNPVWAYLIIREVPGTWALVGGAVIISTLAANSLYGAKARA